MLQVVILPRHVGHPVHVAGGRGVTRTPSLPSDGARPSERVGVPPRLNLGDVDGAFILSHVSRSIPLSLSLALCAARPNSLSLPHSTYIGTAAADLWSEMGFQNSDSFS